MKRVDGIQIMVVLVGNKRKRGSSSGFGAGRGGPETIQTLVLMVLGEI